MQRDPLQLSQPSGGADRSLKRTHSAGAGWLPLHASAHATHGLSTVRVCHMRMETHACCKCTPIYRVYLSVARSSDVARACAAAGSVSAPGKVDSFEELFRFANQVGQVSIESGATPGSLSTPEGTKLERTESLSDVLHRSLAGSEAVQLGNKFRLGGEKAPIDVHVAAVGSMQAHLSDDNGTTQNKVIILDPQNPFPESLLLLATVGQTDAPRCATVPADCFLAADGS